MSSFGKSLKKDDNSEVVQQLWGNTSSDGTGQDYLTKVDGEGNLFTALSDICIALKYIISSIARPMWIEPGTSRGRVTIEAGTLPAVTTVSTVTTCSTVTSVTNIDSFDGKDTLLNHLKKASWALNVRGRIT